MSLPKPQPCGQNWLDMQPVPGGRLCGHCHKTVVDFSKKKWAEIEQMQKEHNNSLCGRYTNRQFEHWGHEAPRKNPAKVFAATALIVSLATAQATAQTEIDTTCRTIITGTVTDKQNHESIFGAAVYLKGTQFGTITDLDGNYILDVTNYIGRMPNPTVVVASIEYQMREYELKTQRDTTINLNPQLELQEFGFPMGIIVISSSRWQKAKKKIWDFFAPKTKP